MDTSKQYSNRFLLVSCAYIFSILIAVADQSIKSVVVEHLQLHQAKPVFSWLSIVFVYNYGAAFSFLSLASGWQRWFLIAVSLIVIIFLIMWIKKTPNNQKMQWFALSLILGGALGNLYDRMMLGKVVDYILIHYNQYYFPVFNLADSVISLGAALLFFHVFFRVDSHQSIISNK